MFDGHKVDMHSHSPCGIIPVFFCLLYLDEIILGESKTSLSVWQAME